MIRILAKHAGRNEVNEDDVAVLKELEAVMVGPNMYELEDGEPAGDGG